MVSKNYEILTIASRYHRGKVYTKFELETRKLKIPGMSGIYELFSEKIDFRPKTRSKHLVMT
jgi:hypothetical protein